MTFGNFDSQRHCLYVGWVCGIALKHGIKLEPVADPDGNWTNRAEMVVGGTTITVVIPTPPDDWNPGETL